MSRVCAVGMKSAPNTDFAELVEALFFFAIAQRKERQPFDKLREDGCWMNAARLYGLSTAIQMGSL